MTDVFEAFTKKIMEESEEERVKNFQQHVQELALNVKQAGPDEIKKQLLIRRDLYGTLKNGTSQMRLLADYWWQSIDMYHDVLNKFGINPTKRFFDLNEYVLKMRVTNEIFVEVNEKNYVLEPINITKQQFIDDAPKFNSYYTGLYEDIISISFKPIAHGALSLCRNQCKWTDNIPPNQLSNAKILDFMKMNFDYPYLFKPFDPIIRNALGHHGQLIDKESGMVTFIDREKQEIMYYREYISKINHLIKIMVAAEFALQELALMMAGYEHIPDFEKYFESEIAPAFK